MKTNMQKNPYLTIQAFVEQKSQHLETIHYWANASTLNLGDVSKWYSQKKLNTLRIKKKQNALWKTKLIDTCQILTVKN